MNNKSLTNKLMITINGILLAVLMMAVGCQRPRHSQEKPLIPATVAESDSELCVIPDPSTAESDSELCVIPDPSTANTDYAEIIIPSNGIYADLSFWGFKNTVKVDSCISQSDSKLLDKINLTELVEGSIIYLSIIAAKDESTDIKDVEYPAETDTFLAILDYKEKKSYLIKTDILNPIHLGLRHVYMEMEDTIIIYNYARRIWDIEVYKYFPDQDIYKSIFFDEDLVSSYFDVYFEDDYQVTVECKPLSFSKTFSLLEMGLKPEHLEIDAIRSDEEPDDYYAVEAFRYYDNGKRVGDNSAINLVRSYATWNDERNLTNCFFYFDDTCYLKFSYDLVINKYFLLGQGSVYLKYNSEAEKFEPAKVSIEIELLS